MLCDCRLCKKIEDDQTLTKKGGEGMLKVGDVVVVKATGVPAHFRNIKPGALFKVVELRGRTGAGITVGDHSNPQIRTNPAYFAVLTQRDRDQIKSSGNTDLAVRLAAIEDFGPPSAADADLIRINVNGAFVSLSADKASALSKKNSGKLIQRKLARALNRR